jgi:hypothetical protein
MGGVAGQWNEGMSSSEPKRVLRVAEQFKGFGGLGGTDSVLDVVFCGCGSTSIDAS